jgi:hypothetical protein
LRSSQPALFWPTFRAALAAKRPYLTCMCPACRQAGSEDLSTIDYHRVDQQPDPLPVLPALLSQPAAR